MRSNFKWMPATITIVVLSITTAQFEPRAFAQNANATSKSEERKFDARAAVAQLSQQTQVPSATNQVRPMNAFPANSSSGKSHKKWIWIAVAVGAGVTAAILLHDGQTSAAVERPSIVVSNPTVGAPQ